MKINKNLNFHLDDHIMLFSKLKPLLPIIEKISSSIIECIENGNKLLIAGNGGSAADSQHFAAELTGRFKTERKGLAAIALTTDSSAITAIGNDYGYENIFDRQLESLAKKNDVFVGISTSGNSKNLVNALNKAKSIGCQTISLLGKNGGISKNISDISFVTPHHSTDRIQETHIFVIHLICELLDAHFTK